VSSSAAGPTASPWAMTEIVAYPREGDTGVNFG
jgi:hypothetical protein